METLVISYLLLTISSLYYGIRFHNIKHRFDRLQNQFEISQYDILDRKIRKLEVMSKNPDYDIYFVQGILVAIDILRQEEK